MTPSVGRIVHYVSRGSADGVYPAVCRAAVITATEENSKTVSLCVLNPEGLFFNHNVFYLAHDSDAYGYERPGTWHWPERVE